MNPKEMKFVKQGLNKFAKAVVLQSKRNLKSDSALAKSIKEKIKVSKNSVEIDFLMNKYGLYQDKGVKGAKSSYAGIQKTDGRYFKYRKKMPPIKALSVWAKSKNIRLRDEKGRFQKGNYKTIGFLIARSIYKKGIKPSLFFTKPFEKEFKKLPKQIAKDFALDVKDLFEFTTKNISK